MTKEDKKWKRKFIAFLKENGIYEKWIYNMKVQHPLTNYEWWNLLMSKIYQDKCYGGINNAFIWANTKEGYYYWMYCDIKWKTLLETEKIF